MTRAHVAEVLEDGAWSGRRAFVVGGGPSLRGFDFGRLAGELWIGCNVAYLERPTVAITACHRFMRSVLRDDPEHARAWGECPSIRVFMDPPDDVAGVPGHRVGNCGDAWGRTLAGGLCQGPLTGHVALNLADVLGASPIYLLGFDCRIAEDGQANYHKAYGWNQDGKVRPKNGRYRSARAYFEKFAPAIAGRVVVLGDSALECFERGDVASVLAPARAGAEA